MKKPEPIDLKITTFPFSNSLTRKDMERWELPYDFHSVYILENGKDAYIGETLRTIDRPYEHQKTYESYNFNQIHFITAKVMEETPAKHFERLLIRLMKVDRKFNILNGNDGCTTHYARRNDFEIYFDILWGLLLGKGLVKEKEFKFIMNSNTYKYSPYIELTEEQSEALTNIINVLNTPHELDPYNKKYGKRPILVNGSAGTGKTVVATSLFHYLRNNELFKDKKIAFVIANVQMRNILKDVFDQTGEGLSRKDIISPIDLTKDQIFDIVICDEMHALRRGKNLVSYHNNFQKGNNRLEMDSNINDELDWVLQRHKYQVLFYDEKQCVKHSDIREDYIKQRMYNNHSYRSVLLKFTKQMRIKAGDSYIDYIYDILYQREEGKKVFENYEFKLFLSFADMRKEINEKENHYGLSKLCSGYAWEWISKKNPSLYDIEIEDEKIRWNNDQKNWLHSERSKDEMGSLYTLRGVDLNYAGVVIGPDLYFDKKENKIKVNKKSLFSDDVKKSASDEEIEKYVLNIYALLLTRAISGTYVYVCDESLREYLSTYINLA